MVIQKVAEAELRPVPRRPSPRARLAALLTAVGVRLFASALPLNRVGVWFMRRLVATFMGLFGPPLRGTRVTPVRQGTVVGEWVCGPGVQRGNAAIFYLHGSGFVICSARTHRGLASRLSHLTGLPVFTVDYRLAPEYPFPAAADDIEQSYRWLLAEGVDAGQVVVAGDSAGGHLALDLVLENARTQTPQPAGVVLFSPLIDLTFARAQAQERIRRDPMISAAAARKLIALYTAGQPDDAPRLQLAHRAGTVLPPFFVQAGGAEMLSADARHLHQMVRDGGGSCELEVWPGQMHVFQALPLLIPEAGLALRRAAAFVADVMTRSANTADKVS
ncbi:alpha/beta hydrolase [Rhodococcus erythropolis]|uniref:alpha/beta hydrolase n=1 Tax=Rhodococcus erythropolis TaxID=1833 RepID=UPI001BE76115|nr:alpha/beta hydrolase [Rhodococcus erythropolis]MBT2269843.1 alpha/beta hydrolase [Rhodococcus erythropolis]